MGSGDHVAAVIGQEGVVTVVAPNAAAVQRLYGMSVRMFGSSLPLAWL